MIHLNNAGSSLPTRQVVDAQVAYLRREARAGGYEVADQHHQAIEGIYDSLASLINADRSEIALTSNATESWQLAFASVPLGPGDRVLTAEAEYASNQLQYLHTAAATGATVEIIPGDEHGQTDPAALAEMIDERVKLIAISHMPTNGGLINPAVEIGAIARSAEIPFLLDACQTVRQLDLDVAAIDCYLLAATGRKYLRGPRGTGFLYARRSFLERSVPPFVDLHGARWVGPESYEVRDDARRYENWEFPYAALIGLGVAADYAADLGMKEIERRVVDLSEKLRTGLSAIDGITVHDLGRRRGSIVTFSHDRVPASEISGRLGELGVNTSVSNPSSTPVDAARRRLPDMVRASVHYYNTDDEPARSLEAVSSTVDST